MNKAELMEAIAKKAGVSKKEAEAVMEAFENITYENLQQGKEITLTGFGTFSARVRNSRMGVNPQKPSERIRIPTVTVPKFKAGKALKDALKAPTPRSSQTTAENTETESSSEAQ